MPKIQVFTKSKTIKLTEQQFDALKVLKRYDVDVCRFIRDAIAEKIAKEWPEIRTRKTNKVPF